MIQTVTEYMSEEDVHTVFTLGIQDRSHSSPFDESLSTLHGLQSSSLFSSSNSSPVATACCLDSVLTLSACWIVITQLSPTGPSSSHAARARAAVRSAADAVANRYPLCCGGRSGQREEADGSLATRVGEKDECIGRGDESSGRGIVERGFRIECGVATAGMGSQQGDLRNEFAFLQQRYLLKSISLIWSPSGFLTAGSSVTRCCFQWSRWNSFVGRMRISPPICSGTRALQIRLPLQRRTEL